MIRNTYLPKSRKYVTSQGSLQAINQITDADNTVQHNYDKLTMWILFMNKTETENQSIQYTKEDNSRSTSDFLKLIY